LSKEQLVNILQLCGLLSIDKNGNCKLITNKTLKKGNYCWNDLLKGAGMDGNYFRKMSVSSVKEIKAQIWWLGIGDIEQQNQYNPSKQFKFLPNGPIQLEDSLKEEVKKSSMYMTSIAELIEEEVSEKNDIIDTGLNINPESTRHSINYHGAIKTLADTIYNCEAGSIFDKSVDELIDIVLTEEFMRQNKRAQSIPDTEENDDYYKLVDLSDDMVKEKLPLLSKLRMPLSPFLVSTLLQEVVKLSEMFKDKNLLQIKRFRGTPTALIPVPQAKNEEGFIKNAKRNKWLSKIPQVLFPNGEKIAVEWILKEFGKKYEDEFILSAKELGYPLFSKKMNAVTAAAMWQESNVNLRSQRTILRYLANEFGKRLVVPETEISKLGQNFVEPNCGHFIMEKKKIISGTNLSQK